MCTCKKKLSLALLAFLLASSLSSQVTNPVFITDGKFYLGDSTPFNPIVLNYGAWIKDDYKAGNCHVGPLDWMYPVDSIPCKNAMDCNDEMRKHFKNIAAAGFNAIRWGLSVLPDERFYYLQFREPTRNHDSYSCQDSFEQVFTFIDTVLSLAYKENLLVILQTGHRGVDHPRIVDLYADYLQKLALRFKDDPRIFAFDLYNEPSYQQSYQHSKREAALKVKHWRKQIADVSKNLVTIGLISYGVWVWDLQLMDVDFCSYHIYPPFDIEANAERTYEDVFAEYERAIKYCFAASPSPWIIGETGMTVSIDPEETGDWGTPEEHSRFIEESIDIVRDCGSEGYSWWVFADERYGDADLQWFGLRDRSGTWKPSSSRFENVAANWSASKECILDEYYYSGPGKYVKAFGTVTDAVGNPLANAIVVPTLVGIGSKPEYKALSNSEGYFEVRVGFLDRIDRLKVTAPGCETCNYVKTKRKGEANIQLRCFEEVEGNLRLQVGNDGCRYETEGFSIRIGPNPVTDMLEITLQSSSTEEFVIQVCDFTGRVIREHRIMITSNEPFGEKLTLDLQSLQEAAYLLKVSDGIFLRTQRFVKTME